MIYLVTGFMRSGTSMMMAALEAGGLPVARNELRDRAMRQLHETSDFAINPEGKLYELSMDQMVEPGFPRKYDGKAIKVVVPALWHLSVHAYRVCFMCRDSEECSQSYEAAFSDPRAKADDIENDVYEAMLTLRNRRDVLDIVTLNYDDVLADPYKELKKLVWPIDEANAASVVDRSKKRFRREELCQIS